MRHIVAFIISLSLGVTLGGFSDSVADPISPPVRTIKLKDANEEAGESSRVDTSEVVEDESRPKLALHQVPVGMVLHALLETPVNTDTQVVGQPIEASLSQPIYVGRQEILGIQTRLRGVISRSEPPLAGRNAILSLQFTDVILDDGTQLPMKAHVKTNRPDHTWGGELTPGTIPERVTMRVTGIGQYNKTIMRGPRLMGAPIAFPPGERLTLILDEPISVVTPDDSVPRYPVESFETRFPADD